MACADPEALARIREHIDAARHGGELPEPRVLAGDLRKHLAGLDPVLRSRGTILFIDARTAFPTSLVQLPPVVALGHLEAEERVLVARHVACHAGAPHVPQARGVGGAQGGGADLKRLEDVQQQREGRRAAPLFHQACSWTFAAANNGGADNGGAGVGRGLAVDAELVHRRRAVQHDRRQAGRGRARGPPRAAAEHLSHRRAPSSGEGAGLGRGRVRRRQPAALRCRRAPSLPLTSQPHSSVAPAQAARCHLKKPRRASGKR